MDLGMNREVQVSIPMPSNYHQTIQESSRLQQIYGKSLGIVEGMSPPEDLRSQVQGMRPPHHVHETTAAATRPGPPPPPVHEDMRTQQHQQPQHYPQENNRNADNILIKAVRYRECRKNHAASIGGYAVDGCGEFMPSGEEGTAGALKCAACNCHRNFHRREAEGENRCDCHHTRRWWVFRVRVLGLEKHYLCLFCIGVYCYWCCWLKNLVYFIYGENREFLQLGFCFCCDVTRWISAE